MSQITYTFFCFCAVFPKLRNFRVKSQSIYMFFALFFKLFFCSSHDRTARNRHNDPQHGEKKYFVSIEI